MDLISDIKDKADDLYAESLFCIRLLRDAGENVEFFR
jgi:hypothetical protein